VTVRTPQEHAVAASHDVLTLIEALDVEGRLLSELKTILQQQRHGVATDDIEAIDDSVFAAHRVMGTLKEAQKRRRTLVEILTGTETTPLDELDEALGAEMTPGLLAVRDRLHHEARELAREIRINHRVLKGAMEQGSRMIQVLRCASTGMPTPGVAVAEPPAALIDQRV
jgi:hypothetical protein